MTLRFKTILLFVTSFAIILIACNQSPPIEEKKLIKIYSEMLFLQDTTSLSQIEIKKSVLKKFRVKQNDYDNTIAFYNQKPERWQAFFDSVIVYLERKNPKPIKPDSKVLPKRSAVVDMKNRQVKNP